MKISQTKANVRNVVQHVPTPLVLHVHHTKQLLHPSKEILNDDTIWAAGIQKLKHRLGRVC